MHDPPTERIQALRADIARIDRQILELVAARLDVAAQIGQAKKLAGLPVRSFQTEVEVMRRAREACAALGLDPDVGESLFGTLIEAAVGRQNAQDRPPRDETCRNVLVIGGGGRMGQWLCHFFAEHGHHVTIDDPNEGARAFPRTTSLDEAIRTADVIAVATPIPVTAMVLDRIVDVGPRGVVFDICSLKDPVAAALQRGTRAGLRFASVHPMFAPDTTLLSGRTLLVCDCGNAKAAAETRALFADTALRLVDVPLAQHDPCMGYVLGLSHALNIAFARVLQKSGHAAPALEAVAGTTFMRQLRTTRQVAGENPQLYYEIQHQNAHTPVILEALAQAVTEVAAAAACDTPAMFLQIMDDNRRYFERVTSDAASLS